MLVIGWLPTLRRVELRAVGERLRGGQMVQRAEPRGEPRLKVLVDRLLRHDDRGGRWREAVERRGRPVAPHRRSSRWRRRRGQLLEPAVQRGDRRRRRCRIGPMGRRGRGTGWWSGWNRRRWVDSGRWWGRGGRRWPQVLTLRTVRCTIGFWHGR